MTRKSSLFEAVSSYFARTRNPQPAPFPRKVNLTVLEPRILFSAGPLDAPVEAEPAADLSLESDPSSEAVSAGSNGVEQLRNLQQQDSDTEFALSETGVELIIVDEATPDYESLIDSIINGGETTGDFRIVVLKSDSDGISQISAALQQYSDLSAVHLVSHGTDGMVQLGSTQLSLDNLDGYAGEIAGWNGSLQSGADLLIYGCDLAATADGQALVETLSLLTDADVAASTDLTGHESLGGDWDLEYQVGEITTGILVSASFQEGFFHLLDINIDQAWLDANGDGTGPYYLDQEGETYILQTDVTTEGTAFAVIADNITFDLNGHTITYNDAAPIEIFNHSFELGNGTSADGWDFSQATSAERFQGEYLQNEIYDGQYSLHFASGFSGTQYITSQTTVTLEANTTYSLSAMLQNSNYVTGTSSFVQLVGQNIGDTHEVIWDRKNSRGIQWQETVFTTGAVAETYTLIVGVDNPDSDPGFHAFIDDIKIQQTKTYGLALGPTSWDSHNFPGLERFGNANNFYLTSSQAGGSILQGQDEGSWSHGIHYRRSANPHIENVTISVSGANSSTINLGNDATIHGNTLISDVKTIRTRDSFHGAVLKAGGSISANTVIGGPHTGILAMSSASEIYDNEISIRSKYTNGFAIMLWNDQGSEVHSNTVDTLSADFGGRGIHVNRKVDTVGPDTIVRDNGISVKEVGRNQEYGGTVLGGVYGIQVEGGTNVQIYRNTVHAVAADSDAYALRLNNYSTNDSNVNIFDNTFTATRLNTNMAAASMKFQNLGTDAGITIRNNVLESDHQWLGDTWYISSNAATIKGNTLTVIGSGADFAPVQGRNWGSGADRDVRAIHGLRFVDNRYSSPLAESLFESSAIDNWYVGVEFSSSIFQSFTHTFQITDTIGNPIEGATFTVMDGLGTEVASGITDANGEAIAILDEFMIKGSDKTEFGPYTINVAYSGEDNSEVFHADQKQVITVSLDLVLGGVSDGDPPALIHNETLTTDEGHTIAVSSTFLLFEDSQQPAERVSFTVTGGLDHGQLELTADPNVPLTTFTQEDINLGRLVYRHDDSETTADSFSFVVDDGQGNSTGSYTFDLTINPVDDTAPVLTNNLGFTLREGAVAGIGGSLLRFDDTEQSAGSITYSITGGLDRGQLELTTDPGFAINSFTQEDIDAGRVVYRHDDSETTSDSFSFVVDDGHGNSTGSYEFDLTISPVDDTAPEVVNNKGKTLDQGAIANIERFQLRYWDTERPAGRVTFTITNAPSHGQLELKSAPNQAITSFTQQEVNLGKLVYRHNGNDSPNDSFTFDVSDDRGNVTGDQTFELRIEPVDNSPPEVVNNEGKTLARGDVVEIERFQLRYWDDQRPAGRVTFTVTDGPTRGRLELTTSPNQQVTSFTQQQINLGELVYRHDGSYISSDVFTFDVSDDRGNVTAGQLFELRIDGLAPELVNNKGLTLQSGTSSVIERFDLRFHDEQLAGWVTYQVTDNVSHGRLYLTTDPTKSIMSFTQQEVNLGLLAYRHDGSGSLSDSFTFFVDDGLGNTTDPHSFEISIS